MTETPRVPDEPRATVASAIYEAWRMIEAHANPQSASPVLADAAIDALKAAGWRPAATSAIADASTRTARISAELNDRLDKN